MDSHGKEGRGKIRRLEIIRSQNPDRAGSRFDINRGPLAGGTGDLPYSSGAYTNGWCCIATGSNEYADLQCLDIQSGNPNPNGPYFFEKDANGNQLPALGDMVGLNGFAVAPGGDGNLWVLNVNNIALANNVLGPLSVTPPQVLSNILTVGNSFVYVSVDGYLNAITLAAPNGNDLSYTQVWRITLNTGQTAAAEACVALAGSTVVASFGAYLAAFDISSGTPTPLWNIRSLDGNDVLGLSADSANAYVAFQNSVNAYSLADNTSPSPWAAPYSSSQPGNPVCYNNVVYFGDGSGNFIALDTASGQKEWELSLGSAANNAPIIVEDGIAYVATLSTINAINLSDYSNFTYTSDQVQLLGVENGIAFLLGIQGNNSNTNLLGVNLGLQAHGFAAESTLLADSVVSSTSSQPASPAYRTVIQLLDPNKNPRAFISVKLWASDDVTINSGGTSIGLTGSTDGTAGNSFLWLTTDASGTLYFASQAIDVSSPALYLWASFMDTQEAMVVYPDQDTLTTLSTVTAATFTNQTTFDGSPLLTSKADPAQAAQTLTGIHSDKAQFQAALDSDAQSP